MRHRNDIWGIEIETGYSVVRLRVLRFFFNADGAQITVELHNTVTVRISYMVTKYCSTLVTVHCLFEKLVHSIAEKYIVTED